MVQALETVKTLEMFPDRLLEFLVRRCREYILLLYASQYAQDKNILVPIGPGQISPSNNPLAKLQLRANRSFVYASAQSSW